MVADRPSPTPSAALSRPPPHHSRNTNQHSGKNNGRRPWCDHCQVYGHVRDKCWVLHGYPPGYQPRGPKQPQYDRGQSTPRHAHSVVSDSAPVPGLTNAQYQQLLHLLGTNSTPVSDTHAGMVTSLSVSGFTSPPWLFDSGASDHMTCDFNGLINIVPLSSSTLVRLPNGTFLQASHKGDKFLTQSIVLKDVLYIPSFKFNLISVQKLTTTLNCALIFFPTFCTIQDLSTKRPIGAGMARDGLYYFSPMGALPSCSSASTTNVDTVRWHNRLGHPSRERLSFLSPVLPDLTTKQIFVSRDVVFHETTFPFSTEPSPPPSGSVLPISLPDVDLGSVPSQPPTHYCPHP